jgi:hypothetical protein
MLSLPPLHDDLLRAVEAMAGLSLHQLLQQQGILRKLARDLALNGLRQGVRLSHRQRRVVPQVNLLNKGS